MSKSSCKIVPFPSADEHKRRLHNLEVAKKHNLVQEKIAPITKKPPSKDLESLIAEVSLEIRRVSSRVDNLSKVILELGATVMQLVRGINPSE